MPLYQRKAYSVSAEQVREAKFVTTADGEHYARPGDWIVIEDSGAVNVCEDWVFRLKFELVDSKSPGGG